MTFLVAQMVKASAYNVGDPGSNPGLGRSPREGNGNPLQYSCMENSMDRRASLFYFLKQPDAAQSRASECSAEES